MFLGRSPGLPYSDDLSIIGTDPAAVVREHERVQLAFEWVDFRMHEEAGSEEA